MSRKIWTLPECSSCLVNISFEIIDRSTKDEGKKIKIFQEVFKILEGFNPNSITFDLANKIIEKIEDYSDIDDPYLAEKETSNKISLQVAKKLDDEIIKILKNDSHPSFKDCLTLSLVGNVMDFATGSHKFELNQNFLMDKIKNSLNKEFAIDDSIEIYDFLKSGKKRILYCLDNAGEIVFDKLLIEKLISMKNEVVAVVKNKPYANDVLIQDAIDVNLTKTCRVISAERFGLGFINDNASQEFLKELERSDIIISKGQNNFETFTFYREKFNKNILFLLITKCRALSKFLNVPIRSFIVKFDKYKKNDR
ncbi:MAG: damage-control phosphatase ARMT1 family protein [Candidatus Helarchaeota archaeon]